MARGVRTDTALRHGDDGPAPAGVDKLHLRHTKGQRLSRPRVAAIDRAQFGVLLSSGSYYPPVARVCEREHDRLEQLRRCAGTVGSLDRWGALAFAALTPMVSATATTATH